ncbi:hypothetical protein GAYE_SCF19G3973 [Galdieria yellowstonensis]|jgi:uncharacterized coiled-coil protein SlyX|uniref:Uncharacterized protein n=1 Tax=Galdieria yellowstonensis TaxID=3028027 RepID=A0AAV9IF46_9RHOD|nr:hypothetical protein GAYE_SCF19G3973 [Galdieria yellowstonensis]
MDRNTHDGMDDSSLQDQVLEQWKYLEKNTSQLSYTIRKVRESLGNICDKILATESKLEQLTTPLHASAREVLVESQRMGEQPGNKVAVVNK